MNVSCELSQAGASAMFAAVSPSSCVLASATNPQQLLRRNSLRSISAFPAASYGSYEMTLIDVRRFSGEKQFGFFSKSHFGRSRWRGDPPLGETLYVIFGISGW